MHIQFKNKKAQGKRKFEIIFSMLMLLFSSWLSATEISIPGTGRGIGVGQSDTNWDLDGYWSYIGDQYRFGVTPKGTATQESCIVNGDRQVTAEATRPKYSPVDNTPVHGVAEVFFFYRFTVITSGHYEINCVVSFSNQDGTADIAKLDGSHYTNTVANTHYTIPGSACQSVHIEADLQPGEYAFRIHQTLAPTEPVDEGGTTLKGSVKLTVSSNGGNEGVCVPALVMDSPNTVSIPSGGNVNITFSNKNHLDAIYAWIVGLNTNVTGMSSGTGNALVQTLTNHSSQTQTVIYYVTPKSLDGTCSGPTQTVTVIISAACIDGCDEVKCKDCIGSFAPAPGDYTITAWVQESNSTQEVNYSGPRIGISFTANGTPLLFEPTGVIIDGWQRIEGGFKVTTQSEIFVQLINTGDNEIYFDDLRIQPEKASLKSFVYDPISMKLMAELDENNYATFYEYDEEGVLIRVKKETERGVKTINETAQNASKKK